MSGGFGAGFLKGAMFSLIALGAVSLVAPLDPRDPGQKSQVDLSTPSGSGFNAERSDTNPVLPDTDQTVVTEGLSKPEISDGGAEIPTADTATAGQPDAQGGVEMPSVAPDGDELALTTPATESARVSAPAALGMPTPEIDNPVTEIPVNRLPTISPPTTEVEAPPAISADSGDTPPTPPEPTAVISERADNSRGAFARNRVAFDNPSGKPLMSIILVDAGEEGLDQQVLQTFTFPVTFALSPDMSGTTAKAKSFARQGFEILALAPSGNGVLEAAESPGAIATALQGVFAKIPESVGLVDLPTAGIQKSPALSDQVIEALIGSGHGLVTYPVGLNGTDQKAIREGVPSGIVFRVLDAERETGTVIKRYLDRAVLEAGKTGHVIVMGRTYPETVTALFSWALSAKATTVALAPISAVMTAR